MAHQNYKERRQQREANRAAHAEFVRNFVNRSETENPQTAGDSRRKEESMSLLSAIADKKSNRKHEAIQAYVAILEKGDEADADRLLELMEELGKTSTNVAADLQVLASWRGNLEQYQNRQATEEDYHRAEHDLKKMTHELAAFKAGGGYDPSRDTLLEKAHLRFNAAENSYRVVLKLRDVMAAMKAQHRDLLANQVLPA